MSFMLQLQFLDLEYLIVIYLIDLQETGAMFVSYDDVLEDL